MRVEVLFFAQLKDVFGTERRALDAKEGVTVKELFGELVREAKTPYLEKMPLLYAVNEEMVAASWQLSDRDVVAFLPPVSGG
jgi:sulfur-carrier protein